MRKKTIGEVGGLEFSVIREKKNGKVHRKVVLAGKEQGKKITVIFSERKNGDV